MKADQVKADKARLQDLLEGLARRDRRALSRLLSLAARGEQLDRIRGSLSGSPGSGRVVAFTGAGGVGKSTLIGRLLSVIRGAGQSAAVLACDPQSPLTGGALLGDRTRMAAEPQDDVFIRSLAAAGGHQSVAEHLDVAVQLARAFGFDWILVETVGAGQGDTAVRDLADVVVVLVQPETGDELQWEKAGLLEVADLVVVHKSDLPQAQRVAADLQELLNLPGCRPTEVLQVSSTRRQGLAELWAAITRTADSS